MDGRSHDAQKNTIRAIDIKTLATRFAGLGVLGSNQLMEGNDENVRKCKIFIN